ncbi:MAG TPA: hypothetical protein VKW08_26915 [Xanthobacteraceae bacterium]|nr:hypothetical protein [Xanthobacteraceae bacterium]
MANEGPIISQLRPAREASEDSQATVFYREIKLAPSVEDPRRLVFVSAGTGATAPDEVLLLRQDYERTARVVAVLFDDEKDTRKELFLLLHEAADRGLRGSAFSIEDGRANLVEVRETILDYAHKVRNRLLQKYTSLLVIFGVLPLLLGAIVLLTSCFGWFERPATGEPYNPVFAWVIAVFWIPAGAAICVWGEFALRMQGGLTYDQLLILDPSRWRPSQRLLITVGVSFIFAFLLAFDAVQVGLGSLLLNDFAKKTPAMSLAVGGITGLAFASVQDIIFRIRPNVK